MKPEAVRAELTEQAERGGPRAAARPMPRWLALLEAVAFFAVGVLLINFLYSGSGGASGDEIGVSGHDSFYHVKMAEMLPRVGLVDQFPWLRFCYFRNEGDQFVSHHYGFHAYMVPFIELSKLLGGDALRGGRWAMAFSFGMLLVVFRALLVAGEVPWRWMWLALFFLLPAQFFLRHAFVRAIDPSLVLMALILLFVFQKRTIPAMLATVAYTQLYLGAVMFAPVLIVLYALARLLGPPGDRGFPWVIVLCTALAWTVGVLTYPYASGMFEFLELQVFGSGLSPDISVGREWQPYQDVWWFAQMCGASLSVWAVGVVLRLRRGPAVDAPTLTLVLANFAFLLLTFKARRFIEYWPFFCLLSSAYLLAPVLRSLSAWLGGELRSAGLSPRHDSLLRGAALIAGGCIAAASVWLACWLAPSRQLLSSAWIWGCVAAPVLIGLIQVALRCGAIAWPAEFRVLGGASAAVLLVCGTAAGGAIGLTATRNETRCQYDLAALREMMAYVQSNSQPGEVIFTDDWDIFPVYFYYNSHNNYIVGLDPKFTHQRRPDLWERYVKISRGQVPADVEAEVPQPDGTRRREKLHVTLQDIRSQFGCDWVIVDKDHHQLTAKLSEARGFAELVWPPGSFMETRNAPFHLYHIRGGSSPASAPAPNARP